MEQNEEQFIEPVELFLRDNLHPDKLITYQSIIDIFKEHNLVSHLDVINGIVAQFGDYAPSEKCLEIHYAFENQLVSLIGEFDIIVETGNLNFLYRLYRVLVALEDYIEHRYIYNICTHGDAEPRDKLFEIINIVDTFDELEYTSTVQRVALSFINKLAAVHLTYIEEAEDAELEESYTKTAQYLQKLKEKFPQLQVFTYLEDRRLKPGLPAQAVTHMTSDFFREFEETEIKGPMAERLAIEIIGFYLLVTAEQEELKELLKSEMKYIFDSEDVIIRVNAFIAPKLMELLNG